MTGDKLQQAPAREWLGHALTAGFVMAGICWVIGINPQYFSHDDVQQYFLPMAREVGSQLREGNLPFLTLNTWRAGFLSAELQLGMYNPLVLLLYWFAAGQQDLTWIANIFASLHLLILATGTYALARQLGAKPSQAVLAAFAFTTNNQIFYWYASSWWNALVATAWLPWSFALTLRATEKRHWIPAAGLANYCLLTAGWPHGAIAILLGSGLIGISVFQEARNWKKVWLSLTPLLGGILMAMPAILPVLSHLSEASRPSFIGGRGLLSAQFGDLLQVGAPTHLPMMHLFGGYEVISMPIYYAVWYIPFVLIFAKSPPGIHGKRVVGLLAFATLFFILAQGPQQLGPLRWPFRFVPLIHLSLILATALLMSQKQWFLLTPRRFYVFAGLSIWSLIFAWQQVSEGLIAHALFASILFLAVAPVLLQRLSATDIRFTLILGGVCTIAFLVTHAIWRNNETVGHWALTRDWDGLQKANAYPSPPGNSLYLGDGRFVGAPQYFSEAASGNMWLHFGKAMINGYTPLGMKGLDRLLDSDLFGGTSTDAAERIFERDGETGQPLASLMKLREIIVQKGEFLDAFMRVRPSEWENDHQGQHWYTETFHLPQKSPPHPGTLAYASPGLTVTEQTLAAKATQEQVTFSGNAVQPGGALMVFARPYYRGYQAFLGDRELPVFAYRDIFVGVRIPPGATAGTLHLRFMPPLFLPALGLAILGMLIVLTAPFFPSRTRRMQR
ncbi:MAG TPA: hypothetical protein VJ548_10645 [Azospira sp.]|nr:hypothetical protein [Azospira sp.]